MKSSRASPGQGCDSCGQRLTRRPVSVYRRRGKRHVLFEKVPALVCHACGRRVFEADAVEAMEASLNRLARPSARRRRRVELLILTP